MNFLEKSGLQTAQTNFKNIFLKYIHHPGAEDLLDWLENRTDFFTAPAGAKHHGAYPGGLVVHSLNVWNRLWEITCRDVLNGRQDGLPMLTEETVAILALLHDVCKVGVYHLEPGRWRNPETGRWEDCQEYKFRDPFPLGHGEKSLFLITKYMPLTNEEALAIRWHMGAYDAAARSDLRDLSAAMAMTPWVWRLQEADMCATYIDEREAADV